MIRRVVVSITKLRVVKSLLNNRQHASLVPVIHAGHRPALLSCRGGEPADAADRKASGGIHSRYTCAWK